MRKRVMLTLTAEKYERLQRVLKALGMPPGATSRMIDESLDGLSEFFEAIKAKKDAGQEIGLHTIYALSLGSFAKGWEAVEDDKQRNT